MLATACFVLPLGDVLGQQLPTVGFRNESGRPIIIQGYSIINGVQRRGTPLLLPMGRAAFDSNVPPGIRFYTIYDGAQPSRVLLRDFQVPIRSDLLLSVRPSLQHPLLVDLAPIGP
jgi:hypothetical protein